METITCRLKSLPDEFTPGQWQKIDTIIAVNRNRPGALIPVLEQVQGVSGYLPEIIQRRVAKGLNIPLSQVYGVVTFYSFFTMKPRGRHKVRVCQGTACHVRGGHLLGKKLEYTLGILPGEVDPDRFFSLDIVRCVGACGLAPVMVVDDTTYRQVKPATVDQIIASYRDDKEAYHEWTDHQP
ncbi:MAG: NAD(P)H-dependent oxidoreductase subunit E [Desulfotignum sp.]